MEDLELINSLQTVSGTILTKGTRIKIKPLQKGFKVIAGKKGYLATEQNLIAALSPIAEESIEDFVKRKTHKIALSKSRVYIEKELKRKFSKITASNETEANNAISSIINTSSLFKLCPRCQTKMVVAELSSGLHAWTCPNDRVTLPYEKR